MKRIHAISTFIGLTIFVAAGCFTGFVQAQENDHDPAGDNSGSCPAVYINLWRGSQGNDVQSLQQFLVEQGVLAQGNVSGYFGNRTEAALKQWQARNNIASGGAGWGRFGPATRAYLAQWCNGSGNRSVFYASPNRGAAPLNVSFYTQIVGSWPSGVTYSIDYGDGSSGVPAACTASGGVCVSPGVNQHTYAATGTYTAILYRTIANTCGTTASGTVCLQWAGGKTALGKARVIVGNTNSSCTTGSCAVTISGVDGPTTLTTGQQGTWTIKASDSNNGSLSYSVVWGDESALDGIARIAGLDDLSSFVQTATFTHTYRQIGTYNVRFVVKNSSGQKASSAISVRVASATTTTGGFTATPVSGDVPLKVSFSYDAPVAADASADYRIVFGDGTSGAMSPVCKYTNWISACPGGLTATHTYQATGVYTATLYKTERNTCRSSGTVVCPAWYSREVVIGTVTITATGTFPPDDSSPVKISAPGSVMLAKGQVAEVRNRNMYFTLTALGAATATIQVTPVGCWNSYPSDPTPKFRCEIEMRPIAPQTLAVGQRYTTNGYSIMLASLASTTATFSVQ